MASLAERFPLALPQLRPFLSIWPGFDLTVPPAESARPLLASFPRAMPDLTGISVSEVIIPGGAGQDLRVLIVRPAGDAIVPTILSIHGGGGVVGVPEMDMPLCCFYARNGFAVVSPDYRLAPEHVYPAQHDDVEACFDYVCSPAGAKAHGLDASKLAFYGSSAGSWLATGLAIRLNKKKSPVQAKVVVLDSFLGDDRTIYPSQADNHPYSPYFIWTAQNSRDASRYLYGENPNSLPSEAAPLRTADNSDFVGLPPHYICSCELDTLADNGPAYATRLLAAGVLTELHLWSRAFHAFASLAFDSDVAIAARNEYLRVIKSAMAEE